MSCKEDEVEEVDAELNYRYHLRATKIDQNVQDVFFRIKDYLHTEGNRELFTRLTLDDVALFLYDPEYLQLLKEKDPDFMR